MIKMRKAIVIIAFIVSLVTFTNVHAGASSDKVTGIYFYSPTCGSCQELKGFLGDLENKYPNFILKEYSISDLRNKSLLDEYNRAYNVLKQDEGIVPVIFIRDKYFADENEIKLLLKKEIENVNGPKTVGIVYANENHDSDIQRFISYKMLGILAAGLVNGINPCSMSMLLMFMSLLMFKNSTILRVGISYCVGKFIAYTFLGTVFFHLLKNFYIKGFNSIIKLLMLVVILILIALNVNDYFATKSERYDRVKLQLPQSFRKFNHSMIKKVSKITDTNILMLVSFALGIFISLGEFLCTGQIYLTTIVTVLQSEANFGFRALSYLLIYNLGFILPVLVLTFVIYKGKEVFEVSEAIREKLPLIKIINTAILVIFVLIINIFF